MQLVNLNGRLTGSDVRLAIGYELSAVEGATIDPTSSFEVFGR